MDELIFIVEESVEGGYIAKGLGESIFTQGETLEVLKKNIIDAVRCHFQSKPPKVIRLHIVRDEVITYV